MLIYYDKREFVDKLFLSANSYIFCKKGTVDVLNPNNDFFFFYIGTKNFRQLFYCLGSKIGNFIHHMKPAVWSNSENLPLLLNH